MSLVGSLEDLGLGDILQIVSLSRKSGVLRLRCDGGEGRIVLQDGMVSGAAIKGEFEDTKALLLAGEHVDESDLEEAIASSGESDASLPDALAAAGLMTPEQLEAICRGGVERAVMEMFDWRVGEFTFEVRDVVDASTQAVLLGSPLSSQYIAMEATRKRDEVAHFGDEPFDDEAMLFSGEDPSGDAVEGLALGTLERIETEDEVDDENESTQPLGEPPAGLDPAIVGGEGQAAAGSPLDLGAATASERLAVVQGPPQRCHFIAIDPDLGALEWLKCAVDGLFERVHIFQRAEIGVDRIRHYLGRGVVPVVAVSHDARADRPGGAADLIARLRGLAPAMRIAVLCEEGHPPDVGFESADSVLFRPSSPGTDPERWVQYGDTAESLRAALMPMLAPGAAALRADEPQRESSLTRLKQVSDALRELPAETSDQEVFALVLDFALELFNRVVLFGLEEEGVAALAQRGLDKAGGPSEAVPEIRFGPDEMPDVFRRALERRGTIVSSVAGEADQRLAQELGSTAAKQAYLAPVESGGRAVALLYADNLPIKDAVPDTTALEIVLHEAGMTLERGALRRALADAEGRE